MEDDKGQEEEDEYEELEKHANTLKKAKLSIMKKVFAVWIF